MALNLVGKTEQSVLRVALVRVTVVMRQEMLWVQNVAVLNGKMEQFVDWERRVTFVKMKPPIGPEKHLQRVELSLVGQMVLLVLPALRAMNAAMRQGRLWVQNVVEVNGKMAQYVEWEQRATFVRIKPRIGQKKHLLRVEKSRAGEKKLAAMERLASRAAVEQGVHGIGLAFANAIKEIE